MHPPTTPTPPTHPWRRYGAEQGRGELREALCNSLYAKVGGWVGVNADLGSSLCQLAAGVQAWRDPCLRL